MFDLRIVVGILSQPTLLLRLRTVIILLQELRLVGNFPLLEFDQHDNFQMSKYYICYCSKLQESN